MFWANIGQVPRRDSTDRRFDGWVLYLKSGSGSSKEKTFRDLHERIHTSLAADNISYSEITTEAGKDDVRNRFSCHNRRHPLFLIMGRHPQDHQRGDTFLITEWGIWTDKEHMVEDALALVAVIGGRDLVPLLDGEEVEDSSSTLAAIVERANFYEMKNGKHISIARV